VHPESLARQRLPHEANGVDIWRRRYRQINDCERYLVENGFRVVKLFLNLSKEEQRLRFLRRCELPDRNWKLSANDALERGYWDAYQRAFAEMLDATSTAVLAQALLYIDPEPHHLGADRQQAIAAARAQLRLEAQPLDELEALVADVPTP
jgi:hypothetical protein